MFDGDVGHHLVIEKKRLPLPATPCGILTAVKARTVTADVTDNERMPLGLAGILYVVKSEKTKLLLLSVYLYVIQ